MYREGVVGKRKDPREQGMSCQDSALFMGMNWRGQEAPQSCGPPRARSGESTSRLDPFKPLAVSMMV